MFSSGRYQASRNDPLAQSSSLLTARSGHASGIHGTALAYRPLTVAVGPVEPLATITGMLRGACDQTAGALLAPRPNRRDE